MLDLGGIEPLWIPAIYGNARSVYIAVSGEGQSE